MRTFLGFLLVWRKEMTGKDRGGGVKALVDECGQFMTAEEKMKWGRELMRFTSRTLRALMMVLHKATVALKSENETAALSLTLSSH
jgi:hypothetical protein